MIDIAYWTIFGVANVMSLRAFWQWRSGRRASQRTLRWSARASIVLAIVGLAGRATETLGIIGESFDPSQRAVILVPAWRWGLIVSAFAALPILAWRKARKDLGDAGNA